MTDEEIEKLKRPELFELMYYMREEIDALINENGKLRERINQLIISRSDKELRKLKNSEVLDLVNYMKLEVESLRNENIDLNDRLDSLLNINNQPLPPEPEAEMAVITND